MRRVFGFSIAGLVLMLPSLVHAQSQASPAAGPRRVEVAVGAPVAIVRFQPSSNAYARASPNEAVRLGLTGRLHRSSPTHVGTSWLAGAEVDWLPSMSYGFSDYAGRGGTAEVDITSTTHLTGVVGFRFGTNDGPTVVVGGGAVFRSGRISASGSRGAGPPSLPSGPTTWISSSLVVGADLPVKNGRADLLLTIRVKFVGGARGESRVVPGLAIVPGVVVRF